MLNRVSVRLFLNMLIPLLLGLFIYLTSGSNTYISDYVATSGIQFIRIQYPQIIKNYMCDFLWGYSLYSGLRLFNDNRKVAFLTALITATVMETSQLASFVPGTFDVWDIIVELSGISLAVVTTSIISGRQKNEETKNT